jgi:hypothetical protein
MKFVRLLSEVYLLFYVKYGVECYLKYVYQSNEQEAPKGS